jgi:hypothetical protein
VTDLGGGRYRAKLTCPASQAAPTIAIAELGSARVRGPLLNLDDPLGKDLPRWTDITRMARTGENPVVVSRDGKEHKISLERAKLRIQLAGQEIEIPGKEVTKLELIHPFSTVESIPYSISATHGPVLEIGKLSSTLSAVPAPLRSGNDLKRLPAFKFENVARGKSLSRTISKHYPRQGNDGYLIYADQAGRILISLGNEIETLDAADGRSVNKYTLKQRPRGVLATPSGAYVYASEIEEDSRSPGKKAGRLHRLDVTHGRWDVIDTSPSAYAITPVSDDLLVHIVGETVKTLSLVKWSEKGLATLSSAPTSMNEVGGFDPLRGRVVLRHQPYPVVTIADLDRRELRVSSTRDIKAGTSIPMLSSRFSPDYRYFLCRTGLLDAETFQLVQQESQTTDIIKGITTDMLLTDKAAYDLKTGERVLAWPAQFNMIAVSSAGDRIAGYSLGNELLVVYEIKP